ncbi:G2/M phase-specific E3 ubiquitin-protein ligase-like isoform X3 [Triplophysa dalaica]|uniref:G2/M phase-specific E3 ubiquitin-protein ligase-like isoform X3 n=1 Tax=Triplophysa dalaica TaxID=1582913 RepID=UPI0024DF40E5|nr:G2/M phase-specific E3 ubiquitin-protein ligase-like isoform X3 [Triplophysa dalaica]
MTEHDRICGSRCLGPMTFHAEMTGKYVTISQGGRLASRDASSFMDGLVFLSRAIKVNEKMCIQIESCSSRWDGALRIGFTNIMPNKRSIPPSSIPELSDTPGYCVLPVPVDLCVHSAEIHFWMNYAGMVLVEGITRERYYIKAKGLNLNKSLWVFFDLYGKTSTVRLLGSRRGSRTSCPDIASGINRLDSENQVSDSVLNEVLSKFSFSLTTHTLSSVINRNASSPLGSAPSVPSQRRQRLTSSTSYMSCRNSSIEDIDVESLLREFQQNHLSASEHVSVLVNRNRLLQSAKNAVSNCNFSWTKLPFVKFVGEEALDCGGPKREFLRLLMMEVQSSLGIFEGKPGHLFFTYDQMALEQHKYELAGKLIAWSLAHGGPGFKALDPCLYQLMCIQECPLTDFNWHLIPDADIQNKMQKILSCKRTTDLRRLQRDEGDWICECGVPGIYIIRDIPQIYSYVIRHYIYLRTSKMINQFTEGLNAYGQFWDLVKSYWAEFLPIFTNTHEPISRSSFRALFKIHWSKAMKREPEEKTIHYWELVLKMIEDKKTDLRFEELFAFITGADQVPPLGLPQKPSIHFYQPEKRGCRLPYANTCMMGLFLPRGVKSEAELHRMLLRAIRDSADFGRT